MKNSGNYIHSLTTKFNSKCYTSNTNTLVPFPYLLVSGLEALVSSYPLAAPLFGYPVLVLLVLLEV